MHHDAIQQAATILRQHWEAGTRIDALPPACRPTDRASGYAIQTEMLRQAGQESAGWKIAATSAAGQAHIAVDGPLAGRLWRSRVLAPGATVSLRGNGMRVIEAEFAFRMGRPLPPRATPYAVAESSPPRWVSISAWCPDGLRQLGAERYLALTHRGQCLRALAGHSRASLFWRRDLVTHVSPRRRGVTRRRIGPATRVSP
jgi:hypothetical protein